jgi:hypothetical protein
MYLLLVGFHFYFLCFFGLKLFCQRVVTIICKSYIKVLYNYFRIVCIGFEKYQNITCFFYFLSNKHY